MRRWIIGAGLAVVTVAIGFWLWRPVPQFSGLEAIGTMASAPLSDVVVIRREDPVRAELLKGRSLAEAFSKDPKPFEDDLALVHTYLNAMLVAEQSAGRQNLPLSSAEFQPALREAALDHWNRPYCVTGNDDSLVIISSGQNQKEINCGGIVGKAILNGLPRGRLIKTDSGYLTLVLERKTLKGPADQRR